MTSTPPERLPLWLIPHLYRHYMAGNRANHCVDAALTLSAAFEALGIAAQPWPVELVIDPGRGRPGVRYGKDPRWDGDIYRGHCVLWLPQHEHFVDVTLEQFKETAGQDVLVGRTVGALDQASEGRPVSDWLSSGGTAVVPRGDCVLQYTAGTAAQAADLLAAPSLQTTAAGHNRAGTNLASQAVLMLTVTPQIAARSRSGPFPRLRQLVDGLAGIPATIDEQNNWRFTWPDPAGTRHLLLDEIPL